MAISVLFPDGTRREVPTQLRQISFPKDNRTPPRFEQVPLNCDSFWKYVAVKGRWLARARVENMATLVPQVQEWWRSIEQMDDDKSSPPSTAAA